jgi:hypothetical protein
LLPIFIVSLNKPGKNKPLRLPAAAERVGAGKLFFAVVADGLDGAAFKGFHAKGSLFLGGRLLMDEGIAAFVMARKEIGRRFAAEIAVNALLIDVEFARGVVLPLLCFVSHGRIQECCSGMSSDTTGAAA